MVWWWDERLRLQYPNYVHKLCYKFLSAFHTHSSNSIFANTGSTSVSAKDRTDANAIALLLLFLAHIHILPYKYVQGTGYSVHMQRKQALKEQQRWAICERHIQYLYAQCELYWYCGGSIFARKTCHLNLNILCEYYGWL